MPIGHLNTAQTLFWIVTRQWPYDALLDDDSRSALALALREFVGEPLAAIDLATTELEDALRKRDVVCTVVHDQSIEIRSGTGGDSKWGYYAKVRRGSETVQDLRFPVASIRKRWPMANASGRKRGPKEKYDATAFLAKARELLEWEGGIGPSYAQATFKAQMQEWCIDAWGSEPGQTWLKQHLATALTEYEATKRR